MRGLIQDQFKIREDSLVEDSTMFKPPLSEALGGSPNEFLKSEKGRQIISSHRKNEWNQLLRDSRMGWPNQTKRPKLGRNNFNQICFHHQSLQ